MPTVTRDMAKKSAPKDKEQKLTKPKAGNTTKPRKQLSTKAARKHPSTGRAPPGRGDKRSKPSPPTKSKKSGKAKTKAKAKTTEIDLDEERLDRKTVKELGASQYEEVAPAVKYNDKSVSPGLQLLGDEAKKKLRSTNKGKGSNLVFYPLDQRTVIKKLELPKPLSTAHVGILHVNKTTPYELLGGKTSLPDANAKKAKAFVTTLLTQYARNEFQLAPNEKDMQVSTSPLRYDSPMMKQIMRTQTTMEFGSVTQAEIDRQNGFRNNRFIPILAIVLTVNNTNSKESMQATIFGISRCSASLTTYSIVINQVIYGSNVYYGDLSAYSY